MKNLMFLIISLNLLLSCNNEEPETNTVQRELTQEEYDNIYGNNVQLAVTFEEKDKKAYDYAIKTMEMNSLLTYLRDYPEGKYIEKVKSVKDSIWDEGIANYTDQAKLSKDKKAVRFFKKVLTYMKEHDVNEIGLNLIKKIELKGYDDYSKDDQALMAMVYTDPPLSKKNVISPTSLAGRGDTDKWLIMGFKQDMEQRLFKINTDGGRDLPLSMTIEYTIKNQEEENFPHVWTYTEDDIFKSYLLGIAISFKLTFTIPGTKEKYTLEVHEDPSGNIGEVLGISDGYGAMAEKTFVQFSNDVVSRFGFEATYETMHEKMMKSF